MAAVEGELSHSGMVSYPSPGMKHDAVLDYYGRRLATCSSDRSIKIFEVEGESQRLVETLKGYRLPTPFYT